MHVCENMAIIFNRIYRQLHFVIKLISSYETSLQTVMSDSIRAINVPQRKGSQTLLRPSYFIVNVTAFYYQWDQLHL